MTDTDRTTGDQEDRWSRLQRENKELRDQLANMRQADAWGETISFCEAIKRTGELRDRAVKARERLLKEGCHWKQAEEMPCIPVIHSSQPPTII